ncbi:MAG: hypothetical protein AAGK97_17940, partial [Bacteroidota bacterium]
MRHSKTSNVGYHIHLVLVCVLMLSFSAIGQSHFNVPQDLRISGVSYDSNINNLIYFSDAGVLFDNFTNTTPQWLSAPGIQDVTASLK